MDENLGHYFCIFCKFASDNIDTTYKHYKQHMKLPYYCVQCDNASAVMDDTVDYKKHCKQRHQNVKITACEDVMINMWIERFLSYQKTILDKSYKDLVSCKEHPMFAGCPVCQCLLMACQSSTQSDVVLSLIKWTNQPSTPNVWRHSCSHLHYYPYMCLVCEKVGRYHKKCDFSEIARHFKTYHAIDLRDCDLDGMVNHVQISKIESFIQICSNIDKYKLNSVRKSGRKKSSTDYSELEEPNDNKRVKIEDNNASDITERVYNEVMSTINQFNNVNNTEHKYFCVFCDQTFADTESASRHYKQHIDYYPILCLICNKRLTDLQSFVTHHSQTHPTILKGKYKKKERTEVDIWIKSFLLFQSKITGTTDSPPQQSVSHLSHASCVNCPVCAKLIKIKHNSSAEFGAKYDNQSFSVHLHQHLVYYPYECALCKHIGKSVRVANLDSVAVTHMREHQTLDINDSTDNLSIEQKLSEIFPKTLQIMEIEKLIECSVSHCFTVKTEPI